MTNAALAHALRTMVTFQFDPGAGYVSRKEHDNNPYHGILMTRGALFALAIAHGYWNPESDASTTCSRMQELALSVVDVLAAELQDKEDAGALRQELRDNIEALASELEGKAL